MPPNALELKTVLVLNANWHAISVTTPQDAFTRMSRIPDKKHVKKKPFCALNIEYPVLEDGSPDYGSAINIEPVLWDKWIDLPTRSWDRVARTAKTQIRVPTIIIANNYKGVPKKTLRYSKSGVWQRDGYLCQVTKIPLTHRTGSIDHWLPSSRGGSTSFENCILVSKDVNSRKGDYTMEEYCSKHGLPMPQKPSAPASPNAPIVNTYGVKDWDLFL